ncbi:DedA family protein [Spirochaetota bacterium]
MEEILNSIIEFLLPQNDIVLYLFLFLSAVIENLFPPIPGDTITALGAFLVGTGRLNYLLVYISTTLGSVAGFMSLFLLGRYLQREFFINKNYRFFPAESIESSEKWFSKYGYFIVLGNRFMPGIRSVISIVSGILKLSILRVFILSLVSASIWNLIWIQAGFMLGNNWDVVKTRFSAILRNYNIVAGIIITLIILSFIFYKIRKMHKERSNKG